MFATGIGGPERARAAVSTLDATGCEASSNVAIISHSSARRPGGDVRGRVVEAWAHPVPPGTGTVFHGVGRARGPTREKWRRRSRRAALRL